ncbi:MAG: WG repeat-containing protein [Prevotella sp.]|nr:WG repeat-containing protein [Prevotella sp.]
MALIKCSECGHEVSEKASVCPNCGCPIQSEGNPSVKGTSVEPQPQKKGNGKKWALCAILLCLIAGGGYFAYTHFLKGSSSSNLFGGSKDTETIVELTPDFIQAVEQYDQLGMFSEGYAAVRNGEEWAYIDTKGNEVITPPYPKAECVGRFSEGLAFEFAYDNVFVVFDTKGETVFTVEDHPSMESFYDARPIESHQLPYFIKGKLYVPFSDPKDEGNFKFAVYDKNGKRLKVVSADEGYNYYKQYEAGNYTTFAKEHNVVSQRFGVKNVKEDVVIDAQYDAVMTNFFGKFIDEDCTYNISNGVVLVALYEQNDDAPSSYEGIVTHYAYANLKGNDTFSEEVIDQCAQSDPLAYHNGDEDFSNNDEEETYTQDKDVPITLSSNLQSGSFVNGSIHSSTGRYFLSMGFLGSSTVRVPKGKTVVFKSVDIEYKDYVRLDPVNIIVYDERGTNISTVEARTSGEFSIRGGYSYHVEMKITSSGADDHIKAVFHFIEKDS